MPCPRCHGLMVTTKLEDRKGSISFEALPGWHCLVCGEVLDPGIIANRKGQRHPTRSRARPRYGAWLAGIGGLKG